MQLFDINGNKIQISSYGVSPFLEIETGHLSNGIYFLRLFIDDNWISEKVLISK